VEVEARTPSLWRVARATTPSTGNQHGHPNWKPLDRGARCHALYCFSLVHAGHMYISRTGRMSLVLSCLLPACCQPWSRLSLLLLPCLWPVPYRMSLVPVVLPARSPVPALAARALPARALPARSPVPALPAPSLKVPALLLVFSSFEHRRGPHPCCSVEQIWRPCEHCRGGSLTQHSQLASQQHDRIACA